MTINRLYSLRILAFSGVSICVAAFVIAQSADGVLVIDQPSDQDTYAVQREIELKSTVDGDFVAAGSRVIVDGQVNGDIMVAAQNIEIRSQVSDDARLVGQNITVMSPVTGHVVAAGQNVKIEESIGDWASLAGAVVEVYGDVGDDLTVSAQQITINAEVNGDLDLIGGRLDLGPDAVIRGDVKWRSDNEATISPDAQIDGEFVKEPLPEIVEELSEGNPFMFPLRLMIGVVVLFLLFARPLRAGADRVGTHFGWTLLLGFAVLCAAPMLALILFITSVGVWLGFTVLFTYLAILFLGVLIGLFVVSHTSLRRFLPQPDVWQSLVAIMITVIAVGLLSKIPWVGFIIVLAVLSVGIGALCLNAWGALRSSQKIASEPT